MSSIKIQAITDLVSAYDKLKWVVESNEVLGDDLIEEGKTGFQVAHESRGLLKIAVDTMAKSLELLSVVEKSALAIELEKKHENGEFRWLQDPYREISFVHELWMDERSREKDAEIMGQGISRK